MGAAGYYAEGLAGERLRRCYELAPPRVQQALEAEIDFVVQRTPAGARVLELGCGYGRVLRPLAGRAGAVVGIDTSLTSLRLARELLADLDHCRVAVMDAVRLAFPEGGFDVVLCIQNGLSAFHSDQARVVREACRVARPGGVVWLSSYSDGFWPERLDWFRTQAAHGLIGEIDDDATGDGVIVCRDGFRATTLRAPDFAALTSGLGHTTEFVEVDSSTLFCGVHVRQRAEPPP